MQHSVERDLLEATSEPEREVSSRRRGLFGALAALREGGPGEIVRELGRLARGRGRRESAEVGYDRLRDVIASDRQRTAAEPTPDGPDSSNDAPGAGEPRELLASGPGPWGERLAGEADDLRAVLASEADRPRDLLAGGPVQDLLADEADAVRDLLAREADDPGVQDPELLARIARWIEEEIADLAGPQEEPLAALSSADGAAAAAATLRASNSTSPALRRDPLRTRTMARVLAAQGYRERALAIYDELLAERPDDGALRAEADGLRALDVAPSQERPDALRDLERLDAPRSE